MKNGRVPLESIASATRAGAWERERKEQTVVAAKRAFAERGATPVTTTLGTGRAAVAGATVRVA